MPEVERGETPSDGGADDGEEEADGEDDQRVGDVAVDICQEEEEEGGYGPDPVIGPRGRNPS